MTPRAQLAVWLDYPWPVVRARLLRRTLARSVLRTRMYNGNVEKGDVPLCGGVSRHRAGSAVVDYAALSSGMATSSSVADSSFMECSLK